MNLNKLTEKAQEAVVEAQRVAETRQHTQVEPEHLLAALVAQENGVVPAILDKLGISPAQVTQRLETVLGCEHVSRPQPAARENHCGDDRVEPVGDLAGHTVVEEDDGRALVRP